MRTSKRPRAPRTLAAALAAVPIALGVLPVATPAHASVSCDRYASTSGSDGAQGTASAPYRTVGTLVGSLAPGETGCLVGPASFSEDVTISRSGVAGAPITVASAPGSRATLRGRLVVKGDHVVVRDLNLDGRNGRRLPSPTINGDDVAFRSNDVTNAHTTICFVVGSDSSDGNFGIAHRTVIDANRIHDCGELPATNGDHGIYVEGSRDARVTNNYIYSNADRGVQLFPDAQRTLVANNVIDGNGEGVNLGGWNGLSSSNNVVRDNIISNSTIRTNVESWWGPGSGPGVGNVVEDNCLFNGARGHFAGAGNGYVERNNTFADPRYADRSGANFDVGTGSACAGDGPNAVVPPAPPPEPVDATPPPPVDPPPPPAPSGPVIDSLSIDDGQSVSGRIRVEARISGAPVTRVEFMVDGELRWTERLAPYVLNGDAGTWDTRKESNGTHKVSVKATAADGRVATRVAAVEVDNEPAAFGVESTISDGQVVSGRIRWDAVPTQSVSRVEFYVDGRRRTVERRAPYRFAGDRGTWDTTREPDGPRALEIRATTRDGRVAITRLTANVDN